MSRGPSFIIERNAFYANINNVNFSKISAERLFELQEIAKKMSSELNFKGNFDKLTSYLNTMISLKRGYLKTGFSWEEKYLILMFIMDPNLDAFIIFEALNQSKKIEQVMRKEIGFYDLNFIKIEKKYVKTFFSKEQKDNLEDRIYEKL